MFKFKTYLQMVPAKKINSIARDYWAPAGVILTLVLGLLPLYFQFFHSNEEPGLEFELTGNTEILNRQHGSIEDLEVVYRGRNLSADGETLRLLTLRVVNKGKETILPGHYDANDPVGFAVQGGEFAAPPVLLTAGSSYIKNSLSLQQTSPQRVAFSRLILDPGAVFTVQALVLHPQGRTPVVRPSGKIAGISRIRLIEARRRKPQSWLERPLSGDIGVQLTRLVFYPLVLVVLLLAVAALWIKVAKFKAGRE